MKTPVFLYIMDSLRPDYVGCYNSSQDTTQIDQFSEDAVKFTQAISQATWSKPSGVSLLTGVYPDALGLLHLKNKVPAHIPLLAQQLQQMGYRTLGLTVNAFISEIFGFDQGFDNFPNLFDDTAFEDRARYQVFQDAITPPTMLDYTHHPVITSYDYNMIFESWLERHIDQLPFAMLWSMDTHEPLMDLEKVMCNEPVKMYPLSGAAADQKDFIIGLYRDAIRFNDQQFGRFLEILKARNLYDDALIILLSDHGEGLGQHGLFSHSGLPFNEQIHVPLLIKFPQGRYVGQQVEALVELVDIVPTIMDVLAAEPAMPPQGKSLIGAIEGKHHKHHTYTVGQNNAQDTHYLGVRGRGWKYIHVYNPPAEPARSVFARLGKLRKIMGDGHWFFNFTLDPDEIQDYDPSFGNWRRRDWRLRIGQLYALWRLWLNRRYFRKHVKFTVQAQLDERVEARLQALGYLE